MRRRKVQIFILLSLIVGFACNRDQEDIQAFKAYIVQVEHEEKIRKIVAEVNFLKFGYDNVISGEILVSLKQGVAEYQQFLGGFQPRYNSTRKMQQNFLHLADSLRMDLDKLEERIGLYAELKTRLDALTTGENRQELVLLDRQEQLIRQSITNKIIIQRMILFIDELTIQLHRIQS